MFLEASRSGQRLAARPKACSTGVGACMHTARLQQVHGQGGWHSANSLLCSMALQGFQVLRTQAVPYRFMSQVVNAHAPTKQLHL